MRVVSGSESIEQMMELISIQGSQQAMLSRRIYEGVQLGKKFWRFSMANGIPGMDCG